MKKSFVYLITLPFTFLFIVYAWGLNKEKGEYWYAGMSDPSYLYLGSALHIAHGKFPIHVDNPGAPVQLLGALSLRITHTIAGKGGFPEDVISRPEFYLGIYNFILVSIVALSIWFTGIIAFNISKSYIITFLLQVSPFFTISNFYGLLRISPESFLMALGLFWILLLVKVLYTHTEKTSSFKYTILFAFLSGLGVATKLNFLPLCIFPLFILKSVKRKAQYVFISISFFVIIAFLQLFSSEKLFLWSRDLFFQSGVYATGKRNIIDFNSFFPNLSLILQRETLFTLFFTVLIAFLIFLIFQKKHKFLVTVVAGLISVLVLHLIMVAKHYNHHYLLPAMFVMVNGIVVIIFFLERFFSKKLSFILGSITIISFLFFNLEKPHTFHHQKYIALLDSFFQKYSNSLTITSYESTSVPYAYSFGFYSFLAGNYRTPFDAVLKKKYPNHIFYHNQKYIHWEKK